jgi:hypothetical protein
MINGRGLTRAFNGPLLLAGKKGSRVFFVTDEAYAGLGTGNTDGVGSVFKVRSVLFYIGTGQVNYDGAALAGITASSTLSYVVKVAGVYDVANEYQAGHAQPSAPILYAKDVPSPGQLAMNAAVAVVVWRLDDITGQTSIMSLPSNVVTLSGQSAIVQFPLPDNNGQTKFGIGVPRVGFADDGAFYELPISAGGEVLETLLSYTRAVTGATIVDTTNVVDITDPDVPDQFTSADVGRRIAFGAFDSWITEVVSPTQCKTFDSNTTGGNITADAVITHAVDGITRALEISWANGYLLQQNLAPDKSFPPVAADFAGPMTDVLYLDADGIIYVSEPNQVGGFAPSNALFASGPAVLYLMGSDGVLLRFMKNAIGALYYVGGRPALRYYEFRKHQGIKYAQNAGLGWNGRPCAWLGRPCVIEDTLEPDFTYADDVMPEFAGWNEQQTAEIPITFGYDGLSQYECWCFKKMVVPKYAPTGVWCAPTDLTGKIPGNIVAAVTVDHALYLAVVNGANLDIYQYDAGTGSVMVIRGDDALTKNAYDTVTEVVVKGRADDTGDPVVVEMISNFDDANPEPDQWDAQPEQLPARVGTQYFTTRQPNIQESRAHAPLITMTGHGGDCGIDSIATYGSSSDIVI